MKILFVSSGTSTGQPKPVVANQAESLKALGLEITHFCITGKGIRGYLAALPKLRRVIKEVKPDVVHAHYAWSGFLASLAGTGPLVVSLMGSEARGGRTMRTIIRHAASGHWDYTIVKSASMATALKIRRYRVLANGVDTSRFTPLDSDECATACGLDKNRFNIIFVADPSRPEKNFSLAEEAVKLTGNSNIVLKPLYNIPSSKMPLWYNAADMLLLTSLWEGSPNCVKEAMACNLPVVATRVGDVPELLDGVGNCHLTTHNPAEIAEAIGQVVLSRRRSDGRDKVISMGLDAVSTGKTIEAIYISIVNGRQV
ncbi:MAG: glycosyltransferase [Bacteroidales bacterium]|nr:glycosyltransferase [Bacteroidales bacterium]